MDAEKARKLFDEADLIHSAEVVSAAVCELAVQIKAKLADKNPLVLCVMNGGLIFCGQLLTKLDFVRNMIPKNINCIYIRQAEALGLGHAVLCAKPVIGDEPFAVLLADDLLDGPTAVMKQMTDTYDYYRCSVLGVQDVPRADTKSYGIVDARRVADRLEQVNAIVEKPKPEDAPSTLAVVGRYILTPRIFHHLETIKPGAGGEIQLTDGIASLLSEEQVLAYRYEGTRYDCGSKLGYLQATMVFGQRHPEVGADFQAYLKSLG